MYDLNIQTHIEGVDRDLVYNNQVQMFMNIQMC